MCLEHTVTVRLPTDLSRRMKLKLFVAFINISKAYDLLPRHKLFISPKGLGCGILILVAKAAMYEVTESILGCAFVTSTFGVRQELRTQCLLRKIHVNKLIKIMKAKCEPETLVE